MQRRSFNIYEARGTLTKYSAALLFHDTRVMNRDPELPALINLFSFFPFRLISNSSRMQFLERII